MKCETSVEIRGSMVLTDRDMSKLIDHCHEVFQILQNTDKRNFIKKLSLRASNGFEIELSRRVNYEWGEEE